MMGPFSSAIWDNATFQASLSHARTLAAMLRTEGFAEDKIAEWVAKLVPNLTKKQRWACINGTELTEEDFYEDEESFEDDVPTSNTMINMDTPVAEFMRGLLENNLPETRIVELVAKGYPAMKTVDIQKLLGALRNS